MQPPVLVLNFLLKAVPAHVRTFEFYPRLPLLLLEVTTTPTPRHKGFPELTLVFDPSTDSQHIKAFSLSYRVL